MKIDIKYAVTVPDDSINNLRRLFPDAANHSELKAICCKSRGKVDSFSSSKTVAWTLKSTMAAVCGEHNRLHPARSGRIGLFMSKTFDEKDLRQRMRDRADLLEQLAQRPRQTKTGTVVAYTAASTLRWALGEAEDPFGLDDDEL